MASTEGTGDQKVVFKPTQEVISKCLIATARTAGQLAAEDIGFLGSSDPAAKRKLEKQNRNLLKLANGLVANAGTGSNVPELKKPDQIDENWRGVVDVIDSLLERADRCLDEYHGVIRRLGTDKEEVAQATTSTAKEGRQRRIHPLSKPQLAFKHVPKNDETTAFRPLLTAKPHAIVPLEESLQPVAGENGSEEYRHPYEKEITKSTYPPSVYVKAEPIPPIDDPDGKILTWVDRPEQVDAMLQDLKEADEIAVDLEHHDQHTYVGLVCLMQISTRTKDWIVDTLKPWRQDLQVLNEVFADPKKLKVFHGSTSDMIWLQRDLGLYVVGLFDTYHATVELNKPRHGLAWLLKEYSNFDAQKQYQMADWRTRPLTGEMIHYARADTHYLLNIYDHLRNELIDVNGIDYVLQESKKEALQKYDRSSYDANRGEGNNGWLNLLLRTPARFQKDQFSVFRAVHQFRDKVARQADESLLAVMRNDTIFALARTMPEDMPALMTCIHPVSQFVQPKLSELLSVVKKAKQDFENGPDLDEILDHAEALKAQRRKKYQEKQQGASGAATTITGVAGVLDNMKEAARVAEGSRFWGAMLANGPNVKQAGQATGLSAMDGLRLSLPIPQSAELEATQASPAIQPAETKRESPPPEPQEPSTFTIKDLRKSDLKRKAAEPTDERPRKQQVTDTTNDTPDAAAQNDFEPLDTNTSKPPRKRSKAGSNAPSAEEWSKYQELAKLDRAGRRAEFKKHEGLVHVWSKCKGFEKESKQQKEGADDVEDAEPFDYANATSVLNAAEANDDRGKKKHKDKDKKKEFDPYAKALDTPKGLPKPRQGGGGRSKTFK